MASKLSILIETLYKGGGAQKAIKDIGDLSKATSKATIQQSAMQARTADLNSVLAKLGGHVADGTASVEEAQAAFDEYKKSLPILEVEETTSKTKGLKDALGLMATSAAAAAAAFVIAKKAFDLGAEGAQLDRTRAVFDRLTESIGETSNAMIGKLRDATMGMVSDTDLMQSSARLVSMGLASTGDEAAKLSEIAVTLGAAMGKQATPAMEEFALMLANQSTLRLDTFGISAAKVKARIIELTDTIPGMTRETAFMQATLEQAEISMNNLGDAIKPDAYSQMAAEMGNITDELKILASKGLGPAVSLMSELLREARKLSDLRKAGRDLNAFAEEMGFTKEEVEELEDAFLKLNEGFERNIDAFSHKGFAMTMKGLNRANEEYAAGLKLIEEGYDGTIEEVANYVRYNEWVIASQKRGLSVIEGNVIGVENLTDSWQRNIPVIGEVISVWDQWLMSLEAGINPLDSWGRGVAEITKAGENIIPVLDDGTEAAEEAASALAELAASALAARAALGGKTVSNLDALVSAAETGVPIVNDFDDALFRAAAAAGAPMAALMGLAQETDNYTDAQIRAALKTAAVQAKIQLLAEEVANGTNNWITAADELDAYIESLDRVPTEVHTTFTWNYEGPPAPEPWQTSPQIPHGPVAHSGADFVVPPGYPNDSYPLRVESGEHVQVTPAGKQGKGGNTVNVTVYTGSGNADLIGNKVAGRVAEVLGVRG